ncbi:MAG: hypothetical protein D6765_07330 [Bacteroidetes bacterium]|nr:MAG: hypothetical protein D6765_07330 [Bacteroidota bacterium]
MAKKHPPSDEYLGNIWGWKFSLFSALLILLLLGLILARWWYLGKPELFPEKEPLETPLDSTNAPAR